MDAYYYFKNISIYIYMYVLYDVIILNEWARHIFNPKWGWYFVDKSPYSPYSLTFLS